VVVHHRRQKRPCRSRRVRPTAATACWAAPLDATTTMAVLSPPLRVVRYRELGPTLRGQSQGRSRKRGRRRPRGREQIFLHRSCWRAQRSRPNDRQVLWRIRPARREKVAPLDTACPDQRHDLDERVRHGDPRANGAKGNEPRAAGAERRAAAGPKGRSTTSAARPTRPHQEPRRRQVATSEPVVLHHERGGGGTSGDEARPTAYRLVGQRVTSFTRARVAQRQLLGAVQRVRDPCTCTRLGCPRRGEVCAQPSLQIQRVAWTCAFPP
jgi:hypothetical protein